jgi:hypothetical protein
MCLLRDAGVHPALLLAALLGHAAMPLSVEVEVGEGKRNLLTQNLRRECVSPRPNYSVLIFKITENL